MEGDILYKSQLDENGCNKADEMYLNVGTPDNDALRRSVKMMATATKHRMKIEESEGNLFQYGPVRGDYRFRENLAKFLTDHYQDTVIREDLFVTAGATMGLAYLTTRLFPTGSTIFVENPTYYIAISVLRDELGMNIVPVFSKNGAIDVEAFEHQLESAGLESYVPTLARPFSSMLYLVSTFNNPTGISCPPDVCTALVKLARKHNILLFCDDVYNVLSYADGPPPKRLFAYDKRSDPEYVGSVISNGSFSKIMGPGVRLGWYEAPPKIIESLLVSPYLSSGGCVAHTMSGIFSSMLELGLLTEHVKYIKLMYKVRMALALRVLKDQLPEGSTFTEPQGGYFIWVTLPEGIHCSKFRDRAQEKYRVSFARGDRFCSDQSAAPGDRFENCMRLCISHYSADRLLGGISALCAAIKECIDGPNGSAVVS